MAKSRKHKLALQRPNVIINNRLTDQSINGSIDQSVNRSIDQSIHRLAVSPPSSTHETTSTISHDNHDMKRHQSSGMTIAPLHLLVSQSRLLSSISQSVVKGDK
eukprot:Selendium_serpulae@DN5748_c0_g1_i1.p1